MSISRARSIKVRRKDFVVITFFGTRYTPEQFRHTPTSSAYGINESWVRVKLSLVTRESNGPVHKVKTH